MSDEDHPLRLPPARISPSDASADAVERIAPRRLYLGAGDIVIVRDAAPRFAKGRNTTEDRYWRFRVYIYPGRERDMMFNSFQHAASEAERLAAIRPTRIIYIEDDVLALLADYRSSDHPRS